MKQVSLEEMRREGEPPPSTISKDIWRIPRLFWDLRDPDAMVNEETSHNNTSNRTLRDQRTNTWISEKHLRLQSSLQRIASLTLRFCCLIPFPCIRAPLHSASVSHSSSLAHLTTSISLDGSGPAAMEEPLSRNFSLSSRYALLRRATDLLLSASTPYALVQFCRNGQNDFAPRLGVITEETGI